MSLNKQEQYIYRIGSDNQHRVFWDQTQWHYEFLAGGVLFDEQFYNTDDQLVEGLQAHGLHLEQFSVDILQAGEMYSQHIQQKLKELSLIHISSPRRRGSSS